MDHITSSPIDLLAQLSEKDVAFLHSVGTIQKFYSGETIIERGDMSSGALIVIDGHVQLNNVTKDGMIINVIEFGPGQPLGMATSIAGAVYRVAFTAITDVQILKISSTKLKHILETRASISYAVLVLLSERVIIAVDKLQTYRQANPLSRLSISLLARLDTSENTRHVEVLQTDLAGDTGVSRVTVGKLLKTLESRGCIQRHYRSIEILDRDKLETLSSQL